MSCIYCSEGFGVSLTEIAFRCGGIFISCVNLWRYFHLMGSPILTLWGHGQAKSLFLLHRHSHVMRKPTEEEEGKRREQRKEDIL